MLEEEILQKVRKCIGDALELDIDEVQPDCSIMEELGAESIDLLDITFRVEKAFGIRIPRKATEKAAKSSSATWLKKGLLTDEAKLALREAMPEVPSGRFDGDLKPRDLSALFTPRTFVRLVRENSNADDSGPKASGGLRSVLRLGGRSSAEASK